MSDPGRRAAERQLEEFQRAFFEGQLGWCPFGDLHRLEELLSGWARAVPGVASESALSHLRRLFGAGRPSRYENPVLYRRLRRRARRIEISLRALEDGLPCPVVLGSLPVIPPNALLLRADQGGAALLLFCSSLEGLLFRIAQALVLALPLEDVGEAYQYSFDPARVGDNLDRNGEAVDRLTALLEALVVRGSIYGAPMLLASEPVNFLANQLSEAALLFVLAHEYGHLRNGDLERAETPLAALAGSRVPEMSTSWQEEYEADAAGLLLALVASRIAAKADLAHAFAGCDLLFTVENLRFRALSLFATGSTDAAWPSSTHPPPRERRELLRALLPRILEGAARLAGNEEGHVERLVQGGLIMAGRTESVLEELWQRAEPRLMALRAQGARPHPIWLVGSRMG